MWVFPTITAVELNPFFTFLSFSENTSQVAAILVCYSPVDGEIGSKQFAMYETPIWSSITAGSELCFDQRRSVCNQRCSFFAQYNFKQKFYFCLTNEFN